MMRSNRNLARFKLFLDVMKLVLPIKLTEIDEEARCSRLESQVIPKHWFLSLLYLVDEAAKIEIQLEVSSVKGEW